MIRTAAAEGVCVRPSELGWGVFATRPFGARQVISQVEGEIIDDAAYGSEHCMELGRGRTLEPGPPFRFLNHSCQPNCALIFCAPDEDEGTDGEIWVETLRPVEPGEQLTIDYAWPADAAISCHCQAPNCRGWIVAEEELHRLLEPRPRRSNRTRRQRCA